jgi:calcium-dependent protein kinase
MLRNLTHPNIIPIYEFFEDSKSYSIIVDYCSGGSLSERIHRRGPITEQEGSDLMR